MGTCERFDVATISLAIVEKNGMEGEIYAGDFVGFVRDSVELLWVENDTWWRGLFFQMYLN